jgi:DNA-directed RNA polymerase subunit RPC12/RpoP
MAKFTCFSCGQNIECDDSYAGRQINCPTCQAAIVMPQLSPQKVAGKNRRGILRAALILLVAPVLCVGLLISGKHFHSQHKVTQSAVRISQSPGDVDAQNETNRAGSRLRVSSDFASGSAKVLNIDQANNSVRITPAGNPKQGWPCWWYFRLDGVDTNRPLVLEVTANQEIVQTDTLGKTRKLAADWSLPDQAAFSTDGTNWEHTPKGERQGSHTVYHINAAASTLWLAWGPPFTLKDADQLIQKVCDNSPYAKSFVLAQTHGGRPVPGVRISQPGVAGASRFGVWVQARQHAWESGSSWLARGFAEWLVSDDPAAESLRRKADIVIIPVMDVDSVETGQGGKDAIPHDQDMDWGNDVYFPEVRAGMEKLSALAKADQLDLFLDLHNPGHGSHALDFYVPPPVLSSPQRTANDDNFLKIVQQQLTGPFPYTGKIEADTRTTYDPNVDKTVDTWMQAQSQSHVVSLTLEIPWNVPASTPSGYLKAGAQLGRSIELYLQPAIRP